MVPDTEGANELLAGEAIMVLFTSPIWLASAIYGFVFFNKNKLGMFTLSVLPLILVFIPMLLRCSIGGL